jgi:Mg-chelatase subunit ChlD
MTRVMRCIPCVAFLALFAGRSSWAQESGGGATKENLDLPFDAIGDNEEEEEAPEIVSFYGQTLEADAFFYIIDRSGSMQDSGELAIAKREVIKNISEFSDRVQFGIFFFDRGLLKFPSSGQPAEANPGGKSSGISFVTSTQGGGGTCQQLALAAAIQMGSQSSSKRKVIVYLSDGAGTCSGADEGTYLRQTIASTSAQNWQRIQINTIGVLEMTALHEKFMKDLASTNGGSYTRITR